MPLFAPTDKIMNAAIATITEQYVGSFMETVAQRFSVPLEDLQLIWKEVSEVKKTVKKTRRVAIRGWFGEVASYRTVKVRKKVNSVGEIVVIRCASNPPATPEKNALTRKASSRCRNGSTPIALAAISSSRMAFMARP